MQSPECIFLMIFGVWFLGAAVAFIAGNILGGYFADTSIAHEFDSFIVGICSAFWPVAMIMGFVYLIHATAVNAGKKLRATVEGPRVTSGVSSPSLDDDNPFHWKSSTTTIYTQPKKPKRTRKPVRKPAKRRAGK